ncbi:MAG: hypothetical protein R2685_11105 [Candidatus Nitrosocosmicus sp.]|nr:hypothetical protein [Candidatus Nitrosocosmicus sp.]
MRTETIIDNFKEQIQTLYNRADQHPTKTQELTVIRTGLSQILVDLEALE